MKTTLIMRDDLVRRAKARAALRGQPLSRYMEESLERALKEDENAPATVTEWIDSLPEISKSAARDLKAALAEKDFREIDEEMWQ
jgi:macrodomain Ter protein organizer (MatP/YcbG family)